jgi:hypothetical protein
VPVYLEIHFVRLNNSANFFELLDEHMQLTRISRAGGPRHLIVFRIVSQTFGWALSGRARHAWKIFSWPEI